MKKLFPLILLILLLSVSAFSQRVIRKPNQTIWGSATVTLTNTATDTSNYIDMESNVNGNVRISALFDTTSGSGNKVYVDIYYKVARLFGTASTASDALNLLSLKIQYWDLKSLSDKPEQW